MAPIQEMPVKTKERIMKHLEQKSSQNVAKGVGCSQSEQRCLKSGQNGNKI